MRLSPLLIAIVCLLCAPLVVAADEDYDRALHAIDLAKREAGTIPKQAETLVRLAWPETAGDPTVMWLARRQLVEYANDALPALRNAIRRVPPRYQADVVTTLLEARNRITAQLPQSFLPALEEAIWFGGFESKRIAIPEVTAHRYRPALITMMDAAIEYPSLTGLVAHSLGLYDEDKARHFLLQIMSEGTEQDSAIAAESLARIGGRALGALRNAVRDENAQVRRSAINALLPISSIDDLSRLYEFIAMNPDEDTELNRRITERAELLEILLERQRERESATFVN